MPRAGAAPALSVAELNDDDARRAGGRRTATGSHPDYRHQYMWAVKPHYFTPFYNWPYTFGLLFGIGLYARYVDDPERFRAGYDDLLSAVGHGRRGDARRPVRLRRARRRVLGREPRGARPTTSTTTSASWTPPAEGYAPMRVDELLAEAEAQPFTGWDFSLAGRSHAGRTALGLHADRARRGAAGARSARHGHGWRRVAGRAPVAAAVHRRDRSVAAERRRRGAARCVRSVCRSCSDEGAPTTTRQAAEPPRGRLPFRDGAFHLVVNRHEAFVAGEVARVLAPGGIFLTQQVDNANLDDLCGLLERDRVPLRPVVAPARSRADRRRRDSTMHRHARRHRDLPLRGCRRARLVRRRGRARCTPTGPASPSPRITTRSCGSTRAPEPVHRSSSANAGCSCGRAARHTRGERRATDAGTRRGASPRTRAGPPSRPASP